MKLSQPEIEINREGVIGQGQKFGIDAEDLSHLLAILRGKLYSDKCLAVVREYSCNGWDSHLLNRDPRGIEITTPTPLEPVFKIRDHGPGMSPATIYGVYCRYGKSRSRDSEVAIGGMGIGSKAGFAYGDSFVVISRHAGECRTYSAIIDESRCGEIQCLDVQPCAEDEHGVEIQVPVQPNDISAFTEAIKKVTKFMTPRPIVDGTVLGESEPIVLREREGRWWIADTPKLKNTESGTWGSSTAIVSEYQLPAHPRLLLGNIEYVIDVGLCEEGLPGSQRWNSQGMITGVGRILLIASPGEVDVAANRETLEYTPRTKAWINARLQTVTSDAIMAEFQNHLRTPGKITSYETACRLAGNISRMVINDPRYSYARSNASRIPGGAATHLEYLAANRWQGHLTLPGVLPVAPMMFELMAQHGQSPHRTFSPALPTIPPRGGSGTLRGLLTEKLRNRAELAFGHNPVYVRPLSEGDQEAVSAMGRWGHARLYERSYNNRRNMAEMEVVEINHFLPGQAYRGSNFPILWTNKCHGDKGVSPAWSKKIEEHYKCNKYAVVSLPPGMTAADLDARVPGCTTSWKALDTECPCPTKAEQVVESAKIDDISKVFVLPTHRGYIRNIRRSLTAQFVKDVVKNSGPKFFVYMDRTTNQVQLEVPGNPEPVLMDVYGFHGFCTELCSLCTQYNNGKVRGLTRGAWRNAWGMDGDNFGGLPTSPQSFLIVSSRKSEQMLLANGYQRLDTALAGLVPLLSSISHRTRSQETAIHYMNHARLKIPGHTAAAVLRSDWGKRLSRPLRWYLRLCQNQASSVPGALPTAVAASTGGHTHVSNILSSLRVTTGAVNTNYWQERNTRGLQRFMRLFVQHPSVIQLGAVAAHNAYIKDRNLGSPSRWHTTPVSVLSVVNNSVMLGTYGSMENGLRSEFDSVIRLTKKAWVRELRATLGPVQQSTPAGE